MSHFLSKLFLENSTSVTSGLSLPDDFVGLFFLNKPTSIYFQLLKLPADDRQTEFF